MQSTLVLLAAMALSGPLAGAPAGSSQQAAVVENCLVTLIADVQVPAQEAGVLMTVQAQQGAQVKKGDLLAQVDDSQAQSEKTVAAYEQQAAREKAESDVEVRFAIAATDVAQSEYEKARVAEGKVRGSIGQAELNRLKLQHKKAELQIEQSKMDRRIAYLTSEVRAAEVDAAETNIRRRHILSPLDGMVVDVKRREGEWVQPGEPVLQVIRVDRLWVDGFVSAAEFSPDQLHDRPVTVEVVLAQGKQMKFEGRVVFVDPRVEQGGHFRVRAEVENREVNGAWQLRPGLDSRMVIHTAGNAPLKAAAAAPRRPAN